MKKISILVVSSFFFINSVGSQASRWSVSIVPGLTLGGPNACLVNKMKQQRFDQTEDISFIFFAWQVDYPIKRNDGSVLVKITGRQKKFRSYYFVAGLVGSGHVEGYRNEGSFSFLPFLIAGSEGNHITIDHKTWQVSAGYQYSYPKTRATLALAPSLYLFHYKQENGQNPVKETRFIPGLHFNARLPLGKEKRFIGVEAFTDLNLVPPAKMKDMNGLGGQHEARFKPGSVNMISGSAGLALSLRKR